jgi:hypothetical protein
MLSSVADLGVAGLRTLEEVVRWMASRSPPGRIVTVVTQDEFTHDVVVAAGAAVYVVFDTT